METRGFKRKLDQPSDFKAMVDFIVQRRKEIEAYFEIRLRLWRDSCDVEIAIDSFWIALTPSIFPPLKFSRSLTFDELIECTDVLASHPNLSFPRPDCNELTIHLQKATSRLPAKLLQLPRLGNIYIHNRMPDTQCKDVFECQPWGPDVKRVAFHSYNEQEELPEAVFLTPSITHLIVTGSELHSDSHIHGVPLRLGDLPRLVEFDHNGLECSKGLTLVRAARALERLVASGICGLETPWAALLEHDPRLLLCVTTVFNKFSP